MQVNFADKTINFKIVYFGPGYCGKTTNILKLAERFQEKKPVILSDSNERTVFFDFFYLNKKEFNNFKIRLNLYTIPGQPIYKASRKLILKGVDGIVFVVDSSEKKLSDNLESFKELEEYLKEMGIPIEEIPLVIQYNKRDLPDAMAIDKLNKIINRINAPYTESIALEGKGVLETLNLITDLIMDSYEKELKRIITTKT